MAKMPFSVLGDTIARRTLVSSPALRSAAADAVNEVMVTELCRRLDAIAEAARELGGAVGVQIRELASADGRDPTAPIEPPRIHGKKLTRDELAEAARPAPPARTPQLGDVWRGTPQFIHQKERTLIRALDGYADDPGSFQTDAKTVIDALSFTNGDFEFVRSGAATSIESEPLLSDGDEGAALPPGTCRRCPDGTRIMKWTKDGYRCPRCDDPERRRGVKS